MVVLLKNKLITSGFVNVSNHLESNCASVNSDEIHPKTILTLAIINISSV